jgi:hypothetical protein
MTTSTGEQLERLVIAAGLYGETAYRWRTIKPYKTYRIEKSQFITLFEDAPHLEQKAIADDDHRLALTAVQIKKAERIGGYALWADCNNAK